MCEMPVIFESGMVKARKRHRCCECWSLIMIGEMYERSSGLWPSVDGWDSYKTCTICSELRNELLARGADCISFEGLRDAVFDDPQGIPRNMLPHSWLMDIHERELEEVEWTEAEWARYNHEAPLRQMFAYQEAMSTPKKRKQWTKRMLERAAEATRIFNLNRRHAEDETMSQYAREYAYKQLHLPGV